MIGMEDVCLAAVLDEDAEAEIDAVHGLLAGFGILNRVRPVFTSY